jgi:sugar lactone lactonase YvrE
VDEKDRLYVCDAGNARIQVLDQWGAVAEVYSLKGNGCTPAPNAVAVDRWGNMFVTDAGCSCLRIMDASGAETFRLQGAGPGVSFTKEPEWLDLLDGRLYVADRAGGAVQVFEIRYEM